MYNFNLIQNSILHLTVAPAIGHDDSGAVHGGGTPGGGGVSVCALKDRFDRYASIT